MKQNQQILSAITAPASGSVPLAKRIFTKTLAQYAILTLLFVVLRLSDFGEALAFGLFVGAAYCINPIFSAIAFVITSPVSGILGVYYALTQAAVIVAATLVHTRLNKKMGKALLLLYILTANLFYIFYAPEGASEMLIVRLLGVLCAVIFSFVSIYVVRALFVRGLAYKMGADEKICLAVAVAAVVRALSLIYIYDVQVFRALVPVAILFLLFTSGRSAAFSCAAVFGIGFALSSGSIQDIAVFCVWALAACAFCDISRFLSAAAVLLSELILTYFFNIYGEFALFALLPCLVGAAVFCILPKKLLQKVSDTLGTASVSRYASTQIVNRLRQNMSRRLYELSEVFFQMQLTFKSMVKGVLPRDKAQVAIARDVSENVCRDCPERPKCWRVNIVQTEAAFVELTEAALDRGRATLLDLSNTLTARCNRLNAILSAVNGEVANYKQYYAAAAGSDNSRLLIGDQLGGVCQIMRSLSQQIKGTITYDGERERQIMDELTYCNVLTKEVVIWDENGNLSVSATIHISDCEKSEIISQIVTKNLASPMVVDTIEQAGGGSWAVVYLSSRPRFNISFGFCSAVKAGSEMSGDTHSFIRVSKDKFLLALCDGMGSGADAEKTSSVAISLVENFYKAGFDNDIILSSVNRLLSTGSDEIFTAVDICAVNLQKGLCDFIKLGSPPSLVRSRGEVQFITGSSLPLGVLEEMRPSSTKKALNEGDLVLIMSDGFYDCFSDKAELAQMLECVQLTNPQLIADSFMEAAQAACCGVPKDDMTIIAARITKP